MKRITLVFSVLASFSLGFVPSPARAQGIVCESAAGYDTAQRPESPVFTPQYIAALNQMGLHEGPARVPGNVEYMLTRADCVFLLANHNPTASARIFIALVLKEPGEYQWVYWAALSGLQVSPDPWTREDLTHIAIMNNTLDPTRFGPGYLIRSALEALAALARAYPELKSGVLATLRETSENAMEYLPGAGVIPSEEIRSDALRMLEIAQSECELVPPMAIDRHLTCR